MTAASSRGVKRDGTASGIPAIATVSVHEKKRAHRFGWARFLISTRMGRFKAAWALATTVLRHGFRTADRKQRGENIRARGD